MSTSKSVVLSGTHTLHTQALGHIEVSVYEFPDADPAFHHVVALRTGELPRDRPPLVRVHSRCLYGEVFGSADCDCLAQLLLTWQLFRAEGSGVLIYLEQEGRGCGLLNKARAYQLKDQTGLDTVAAYKKLGLVLDARQYDHAGRILTASGIASVRLLTNNPAKIAGLVRAGIEVDQVPLQTVPTRTNIEYLQVKQHKLGHDLGLDSVDV